MSQRCVPGPYLESKFPWIAEQVNKRLGQAAIDKTLYRVRRSWHESASQLGAYASLENAKRACPQGYYIFDGSGHIVYPVTSTYKVKVMVDALNIRSGPGTQYKINGCIRDCGVYTIVETKNGFGKLKSGAGWICLDYCKTV